MKPPSTYIWPCAKFSTFISAKISVRPKGDQRILGAEIEAVDDDLFHASAASTAREGR